MKLNDIIIDFVKKIIKEDKKNIFHLFYYSVIDAILLLSIPLASAIVINSVLAHATLSVIVLGTIVLIVFIFITILQLLKSYIVEKFQQKVFIQTGIEIGIKALNLNHENITDRQKHGILMNYFFDISAIQKFFPILLLDGVGLVVKIVVSMLLLLVFDPTLFVAGVIFFSLYIYLLFFLGKNAAHNALNRSNAKHKTIYFIQHINKEKGSREEVLSRFDSQLLQYADARQKLFKIIIKQLGFTYFTEGLIFSLFLIIGGSLVISGSLPLGEFVAAEIVVTSITYTLKGFASKLDYFYETVEGFYKVNRLSDGLEGGSNG